MGINGIVNGYFARWELKAERGESELAVVGDEEWRHEMEKRQDRRKDERRELEDGH